MIARRNKEETGRKKRKERKERRKKGKKGIDLHEKISNK